MLKRYELPSIKWEGWAIILLDTDRGIFSVVSDWGDYVHMWTHPGCEFRKFIIGCDNDYLHKKLMHGRPDRTIFEGDKTKEAVLEAVETYNTECAANGKPWAEYAYEKELLESGFDSKGDFDVWQSHTTLMDSWEYAVYIPEPECAAFCEKVMPRFREMLKDELAKEASDLAVLKLARPAILAETKADIEATIREAEQATGPMVGPDRNG